MVCFKACKIILGVEDMYVYTWVEFWNFDWLLTGWGDFEIL